MKEAEVGEEGQGVLRGFEDDVEGFNIGLP